MRFRSRSPEDTFAAARLLGEAVDQRGLVVSLIGPLGAGKTVFAKGLAAGLGVDATTVASPTFVIASEYRTRGGGRLAHVDLYRVESRDELDAVGFADLLGPGMSVVVEWADRFPDALPRDRLAVEISRPNSGASPDDRELSALSSGPVSEAALRRWGEGLADSYGGSG